ncbi:uncharacterized protein LOC133925366 [Phragmites australis]|uniref:uncharacterized protein LOC133925366 n=1 Tax=Phragmites australis TaxID=29695 RepID=UPI002D76BF86|nr:uncharacterized protein LOC133925366 [Phragmites australis]
MAQREAERTALATERAQLTAAWRVFDSRLAAARAANEDEWRAMEEERKLKRSCQSFVQESLLGGMDDIESFVSSKKRYLKSRGDTNLLRIVMNQGREYLSGGGSTKKDEHDHEDKEDEESDYEDEEEDEDGEQIPYESSEDEMSEEEEQDLESEEQDLSGHVEEDREQVGNNAANDADNHQFPNPPPQYMVERIEEDIKEKETHLVRRSRKDRVAQQGQCELDREQTTPGTDDCSEKRMRKLKRERLWLPVPIDTTDIVKKENYILIQSKLADDVL